MHVAILLFVLAEVAISYGDSHVKIAYLSSLENFSLNFLRNAERQIYSTCSVIRSL